jgi:hypothetical protein
MLAPTNGVFQAIIAPEHFRPHHEAWGAKNAEGACDIRFPFQRVFDFI